MEETLTECLIRVREDLNKLKKGREFLGTNLEENSARRLMEPITITSILAVCSSQHTPEITAVEALVDNFHYLVTTNNDPNVWTTFDYELGIICAKVLSAMERTDRFQVMFSKLLSVINEISKNNSDVWKAIARQVLNVFINVKFTSGCLEIILKKYTVILRNIDELTLYKFSLQNLNLLKTFSLLVQGVGDFQTQFSVMEVVFLHLSKDPNLIKDFFGVSEKDKALLQSLNFDDFEEDCRLYLNSLNKPGGGLERKVYSISCHILYLGGCLVEPLMGRKVIWADANKDTERVSFKYSRFGSEDQSVIYVAFPEITDVRINSENTEGNCCVTIQTKKLRQLHCNMENNDICLVAENGKDVSEFVSFLKFMIKRKKGKFSKTKPLFIDRNLLVGEGLQVNSISSSARPEMDTFLPDLINLFGEPDEENIIPQTQIKTPPLSSQERKIVLETQDSPSFLATTEVKRILEDTGTQETFFLQPVTEKPFCFEFEKENEPPGKRKTYSRKPKLLRDDPPRQRVLRERKQPEAGSEDCFRENIQPKKPSLPKLSKKKKQPRVNNQTQSGIANKKIKSRVAKKEKQHRGNRRYEPLPIQEMVEQPKPSLLDPNGYAFLRWMKPTTSKKSNFWLKKLYGQSKQKEDVFEFSDSDSKIITKPKRRVVHSKRRNRKQKHETKQPFQKQVAEFYGKLKKPSPKAKKPSPVAPLEPLEPAKLYDVQISFPVQSKPSLEWNEPVQSAILERRSTSSESSSEDEQLQNQKRDRSEEENSLTRVHLKKKVKINSFLPETLSATIRRLFLLQKAENKARQQTNEIIATMNKATQQLLNHFEEREKAKMKTYLKVAEEASTRLVDDVSTLNQRVRRMNKLILYFKTGCSISDLNQFKTSHFEKIKNDIKEAETKTVGERKVYYVTERLKSRIEEGIERQIKNEMESKRNQLLRCGPILGTKFG